LPLQSARTLRNRRSPPFVKIDGNLIAVQLDTS
jgi:hypothetical protein